MSVLTPAPAVAQSAAPTSSPSPARFPSPNCVDYTATVSHGSVVAGTEVQLRVLVEGDGNRDHAVEVAPHGYTRRPEVVVLPSDSFVRRPGGGLPAPDGTTSATWSFSPTTSSRVWVRHSDTCRDGQQRDGETQRLLVLVAPRLTITAVRNGPRDYTFSGDAVSRPGQTVNLHRVTSDGRQLLTASTTSTSSGTWSVRRRFLGSGVFDFVVRTAADQANTAGVSNSRRTVIH